MRDMLVFRAFQRIPIVARFWSVHDEESSACCCLCGPGMQTMDMGVVREFSVTENARFEARAEFFNLFNHTNLGTPNRFVNTSSFGSITEATTPGREIQLSARLSF